MSALNPGPKVKNVKFTRGLVASRKLHRGEIREFHGYLRKLKWATRQRAKAAERERREKELTAMIGSKGAKAVMKADEVKQAGIVTSTYNKAVDTVAKAAKRVLGLFGRKG